MRHSPAHERFAAFRLRWLCFLREQEAVVVVVVGTREGRGEAAVKTRGRRNDDDGGWGFNSDEGALGSRSWRVVGWRGEFF